MAFEESHLPKDKQTRLDTAIQTEKERKIKEYQRPFLVALGIIKERDETQVGRSTEAPRPTGTPIYVDLLLVA